MCNVLLLKSNGIKIDPDYGAGRAVQGRSPAGKSI